MFNSADFVFLGLSAKSEVSDQPKSELETKLGAKNRVKNAKALYENYDYYVAIEGGVQKDLETGYYECFAYCCIEHSGIMTFSRSGSFTLPKEVGVYLDQGLELGEADDKVFKMQNSKQSNGAIGILTHDFITRASFYSQMVAMCLIPFKNLYMYK